MSSVGVAPLALSALSFAVSLATVGYLVLDARHRWTLVEGASRPDQHGVSLAPERTRVQFPVQSIEDSRFRNYMVSLTHNWIWDEERGWQRPAPHEPSVALTLESYFRGLAELNLDIAAPDSNSWPGGRAMGFAARHDGTYTTLSVGGDMFNPAGMGVKLTAGTTSAPAVLVSAGKQADQAAIELRRDNNGPSLALFVDGRFEWRDEAGRVSASLAAAEDGLSLAGRTTAAALRIGADGTAVTGFHVHALELAPPAIAPRLVAEHRVALPGASVEDLVFVSGPAQPSGVVLSGIRMAEPGTAVIAFANLGEEPAAPASGRYVIATLVLEAP
jgi:hypothetical protein